MTNIRDDFKVFDEYRLGRLNNDNITITVPNAESSNNETPSQFTFVAPKPVNKHEADQDMDAKTIGFDDLLVQVESKTLLSILHKVYNFLSSSEDDLEFPNISNKIEEVLVRIVQNVEVLGSPRMYSTCKRVSNLIVEAIKTKAENKIFVVVCVYKEPKSPLLKGLGVENDNILVYKKLYFTQMKEKDKFPSMSSLSSTPPLSRSTSISSLDSQRSQITLPSEMHFKAHCLHLILKFIKDNNQSNLEFSGLTPDEAEYIHTVFSNLINDTFDEVLGQTNVCVAIREAVKIFALKYEFRIRYLESNGGMKSLMLDKLYKMKTPKNDEVAEEQIAPTRVMKKSVVKLKRLLRNLSSDFIEHNLEKLKNFFSDDTEASIVFSMVTGSKKTFLKHCLNYCRSPVLKPEFPENQRKLLDELCVLVDNKTGYKIKIKDKKKACGKELIFMKIPLFDKPAKNSRPCSLSSTPLLSRSTSVSSLDSQRSHITLPSEMHFKAHCLHLILKFIKDNNRPNLEFSGLTPDDAEYIHTVFSNLINDTFDEVLDQTSVCVAIREAVKIFALKYEFRIRYLESNGGMKSLMLEKLYKMKTPKNDQVAEEQKAPNRFMKKSVIKLKQLLSNLSSDFIEHNLEKLKNFFSDDTEASVVFSMMAGSKKTFLKHCLNYCRSPVLKPEFPENQRKLLDELCVLVDNKTGYKIKIKDKKKACGEKELVFMKIPQFDKPAKNSRPWYPQVQPPRRKAPRMSSAKRKELAQKVPGFQMSRTAAFSQAWANQYGTRLQAIRNSTKPSVRDVKLGPNINFQSGGILNQMMRNENSSILESERDPTLVDVMKKYDMNIKGLSRTSAPTFSSSLKTGPELTARPGTIVNRGKAMRTVQLIEALSVPVKCDKAMRMMVGMGWNGGALGTRGQGIMEPLMPHLTGIGVPPKPLAEPRPRYPAAVPTLTVSNNKRTSAKFRRMFLEQLLELLTSCCDSKTLQLHPMLNKKEKSFLRHAMRTFAARAKLSIADEEQQLVEKVSEQYANDPDLVVSACISDDKKQIVLTKIHSPAMPLYLNERPRPKKMMNNMVNMVITDNVQDLLDRCGSLCQSQKSMESTRFRVTILMEVLNLIKDESKNYLELKFDQTLTMKQRNFIELSVQSVNKRTRFGCSNPEVAISMEIKRLLGDYKLRVKFAPDFKSITATKVYNVKTTEKKAAETTETDTTENKNKRKHKKKENNDKVEIDLNESDIIVEEYVEFIENAIKEANNETINQNEIDDNLTIKNYIKIYDKDPQSLNNDPIGNTSQDDTPKDNISEDIEVSNKEKGNKIFKMANDIDENMNTVSNTPVCDEDLTDNESDDKQDMSESTSDNTNDRSFMSISDHSAYTINLDYTETDDIEDISMTEVKNYEEKLSDNEELNVTCDKPLELSFKSETMLNIDFENKPQIIENSEIDVKIVFLTKSFFVSKDMPKYIQGLISLNIVQTKELPLLKCHGVQDGALIYSCHTKKSYDWLQSVCVANNINMVIKEFDKMCLKVNSYFEFDDDYIISMLEMYNKKLSTKEWSISKKSFMGDCILCEVRMDKNSFKFIVDSDLSLYAGVDKVTFSIIWE